MDEDRALDALRAGDEDALAWFIERYTAYVSTIVKNMLLPRLPEADAEEAVCDVFLALWRGAGAIRAGNVRAGRWTPCRSPTGRYSCATTSTARAWRT